MANEQHPLVQNQMTTWFQQAKLKVGHDTLARCAKNASLVELISYLHNCRLLTAATLMEAEALVNDSSRLTTTVIFSMLKSTYCLNIDDESLTLLFHLKRAGVARILRLTDDLDQAGLLSASSFKKALQKITLKIPAVAAVEATKTSRHTSGKNRSQLSLETGSGSQVNFFPEPNKKAFFGGALGIVKPVYTSADANVKTPAYSIKKPSHCAPYLLSPQRIRIGTRREAKYNALFGRETYLITKNKKLRFITEWLPGDTVGQHSAQALQALSYHDRFACLTSLFTQVNTLHERYRIHGDITLNNVLLNAQNKTMRLIDFGSTHKMRSSKSFLGCSFYSESNQLARNDIYRELFILGYITATLFPEIYGEKFSPQQFSPLDTAESTPHHLAITLLVNRLRYSNHLERCSAQDSAAYCQQMAEHIDSLTHDKRQQIASQTICRTTTEVDDVIIGLKRSPTYAC